MSGGIRATATQQQREPVTLVGGQGRCPVHDLANVRLKTGDVQAAAKDPCYVLVVMPLCGGEPSAHPALLRVERDSGHRKPAPFWG